MTHLRRLILLGVLGACLGVPALAHAHWCDCLWASRYNVVVRPLADTVDLSSPSPTLLLDVQNNMGYPLIEFSLEAYADATTIAVAPVANPKRANDVQQGAGGPYHYLLPGETQRHRLTFTGGAGNLAVDQITFYVHFDHPQEESGAGNDQGDNYGDHGAIPNSDSPPGSAVIIRRAAGTIAPAAPSFDADNPGSQARHIQSSARADFGTSTQSTAAINYLFNEYCAGTNSWADNETRSPMTNCSHASVTGNPATKNCCGADGSGNYGLGQTVCNAPEAVYDQNHSSRDKFQWQHLWAAGELAYRKSAITTQLPTFRTRLRCAWNDQHLAFKGFATFILGYLGPDATTQTFFTDRLNTGTAESRVMVRAALFMLSGGASYEADVQAGLSNGNPYVEMVCAAALAYVSKASASVVQTELIDRVVWGPHPPENEPFLDPGDPVPTEPVSAYGFFAAHLLNLLAWDRRGWAKQAADTGVVPFYRTTADTTDPKAPLSLRCSTRGTPTAPILHLAWDLVTQDTTNASELMAHYRLYIGTSGRNPACTDPNAVCAQPLPYTSRANYIAGTSYEPAGLTAGTTYYFTVVAVDAADNDSLFSDEISCPAPIPAQPPSAVLTCTPQTATVPPDASISCDCSQSTDADNSIQHCFFRLDGGAEVDSVAAPVTYPFSTAGSHTVTLRVVDNTAGTPLEDTDQVTITVNDLSNQAPTAVVTPAAATCVPGASITFDGATSSDPDGVIASYAWTFSDGGTATGARVTHTFAAAGSFTVVLTVTDDDGATGTDIALVTVDADANQAPNLDDASVTPLSLATGASVTLDANGVWDPEGDDFTVEWDFGDGSNTSDLLLATHRYTSEGVYDVTLTATDSGAPPATNSRTWHVTVSDSLNSAPSCANATVSPASGVEPLTVTLDASGCTDPEEDVLTAHWVVRTESGDEQSYDTTTTQHTFAETGTHEVRLTATDDGTPALSSPERTFAVTVGDAPKMADVTATCACNGGSGADALVVMLTLALPLLRRLRIRMRRQS